MRRVPSFTVALGAFWLGSCNALQNIFVADANEPFELVVYRDTQTSICSSVSIHKTQIYRGLSPEGRLDAFITEHGDEKLKYIHYDVAFLRQEAESLCPGVDPKEDMVFMPGYSENQVVLGPAGDSPVTYVKTDTGLVLEMHKLLISGLDQNRVDFVFFSDGCTYRPL